MYLLPNTITTTATSLLPDFTLPLALSFQQPQSQNPPHTPAYPPCPVLLEIDSLSSPRDRRQRSRPHVHVLAPIDFKTEGNIIDIAQRVPLNDPDRGNAQSELQMTNVCCGAHGLSLMIVS